jgi:4-amino-4-deoxy-L-arabinose transferase-like glycosyltransferase
MQTRAVIMGVVVVGVGALLYLPRLDKAPIYIGGDEAHFAVQAHAIAETGRDLNGRFLPLFINLHGPLGPRSASTRWYQPVNFYLLAAANTVLPFDEWSIRAPVAVIAVVSVALLYLLALRLFRDSRAAALAAVLLLLTPAYFIFSRQALDYLLPIPFVLGWLLCLVRSLDTGSVRVSFVGGLLLGAGVFSYLAAWVLMPLLLLTGCSVLVFSRRRVTPAAAAVLGFALPVVLLAGWLGSHPEMMSQTLARYSSPGTSHLTPLQRVKDFVAYNNVQEKVSNYWDYFNPGFLFLAGSPNLTMGTRSVGVFLIPAAIFLLCGVYDRASRLRAEPVGAVLLAGLALAPVPATLAGERFAVQRALIALPLAALVSAYGVIWLWRRNTTVARAIVMAALIAMPIQFAFFYRDYFGEYQSRSAVWFDPIDFRKTAEYVIAHASAEAQPAVYFGEDLDDVGARWGFYLAKHRRAELWQRTAFYRPDLFDSAQAPAGALLVLYANDPNVPRLVGGGAWTLTESLKDTATGSPSAVVLRKRG